MSSISSSSIGFGGISTNSSGTSSLGTTLFGVDVDELVDNLVAARGLTNTRRQDQIDRNTTKLSAYSSLETLLNSLKTATATLRNPVVTTGTADIFDARQVLSTASGSIAAGSLFGASTSDNATVGSYSLTINRVAKSDAITSSITFPDADTSNPLTSDGAMSLNGIDISLTTGMTLNQIRDAINNKSGETNVRASVVKVTDNQYKLVLKGSKTGDAIDISDNVGNTLIGELGLAASGATDQSLSAELVLDGTTIYRSTNSVTDVIPGVSLELFQADPGHPVTVSVDNNLGAMSDAISDFIDAYNAVIDFVTQQRAVDASGNVSENQILYNDNFMISTYRSLQSMLGEGAQGISTGALKTLRDIGIEIGSDNKLLVTDNSKLEDALISNLDAVKDLFGFSANETEGLAVVNRPASVPSAVMGQTVTVNITATDANGVPTAASFELNGQTIAATIQNGFIRGASGTALDGFTVGYTGGALDTGDTYTGSFKVTQGIADRIGSVLDSALNAESGDLKTAKDQLSDSSDRLQAQIDDLNGQLELYRTRLVAQFQAAQEAITLLESMQNSIKSQIDSWNSDS